MSISSPENKKLKKIGIYGGSFDPIHHGHLILAREAREALDLERIIFVPAAVSPFKGRPPAASGEARLAMLRAAIEAELYLLVGEDNVATLSQWRRFDDLKKLVRFVVLDRTGSETPRDYRVVRRKIDISATNIRKRVARGQSIRYLVPQAVEKIIRRQNLYREQLQ